MPAIYDLANRGLLPPGFSLVGFARRDWADQDFAQIVHDSVREHARTPFREEVWKQLSEGIRFVAGDLGDPEAYQRLKGVVAELDQSRGTGGNHAFYLSIPPGLFPVVLEHLKTSGLAEDLPHAWRRVVIEKPFGHDLASAQELNRIVGEVFSSGSVFRIDHYLGKETVQNILARAVRQHDVRAAVEQQLRRQRADHDGRGHRHRRPRRVLRRHRRRPRRDPEPPAAAARAHRDGGAAVVRRRRRAHREGEGAARP